MQFKVPNWWLFHSCTNLTFPFGFQFILEKKEISPVPNLFPFNVRCPAGPAWEVQMSRELAWNCVTYHQC